ncbi:hypothetical protein [Iningainema tapete]|uniref:Uncharacterized protein n=1 Tax=Iningainema tapete BLCC-T55 TaxID=2748662 RepID=A0A8J6XNQ8_9CYAN|nr:hypothetical protein [Iningainema tapete]MBD2775264.1 hypothetical protein [Iningainema tapete BLCC-T55]
MTELLRHVIAELEKLPEDELEAMSYDKPLRVYATRILAEIEDERMWKLRFEATTEEQWDHLAEMVRQQITNGETASLDDVFPPHL